MTLYYKRKEVHESTYSDTRYPGLTGHKGQNRRKQDEIKNCFQKLFLKTVRVLQLCFYGFSPKMKTKTVNFFSVLKNSPQKKTPVCYDGFEDLTRMQCMNQLGCSVLNHMTKDYVT